MSESTISAQISVDEFQALEQKVLRAVEVVRRERELRAAAEAEVQHLRELLHLQTAEAAQTQSRLAALTEEREAVRHRVEKMLNQMDELL